MNCRVMFHDKCFDGACSAALFTRFHRECIGTASSFDYRGLVHRAGPLFEESWFQPDGENAVVDFKFSTSPRLTWWFDHHQSAFANADEEAQFRAGQTAKDGSPGPKAMREFFDPHFPSCTGWIAEVAGTRFGMDITPMRELIHWANIVDTASFQSAKAAVAMREPAMQLTAVIESAPDTAVSEFVIPRLTGMSLAALAAEPFVQQRFQPLLERHAAAIELIRERATVDRGVIRFDITDEPTEGYNKFIPYFLFPKATYHVGLSRSSFRTKISVGTNPWTTRPAEELINIAQICERFGGGGHPRVGAVSFAVDQGEQARAAATQIGDELAARG